MSNEIAVSISVAMCTYNGEKYLREQLDSLAAQTCLPSELVICDDGSADATQQIIQEFAQTAAFPVRFIKNEINLGFEENFLKAAKLCYGDWIAFCDQDDYWMPEKLARIKKAIVSHSVKDVFYIAHDAFIANEHLEITGRSIAGEYSAFTENKRQNSRKDKYVRRGQTFGFGGNYGYTITFDANLVKKFDPNLRPRLFGGHDHWIGQLANVIGDRVYVGEPLAIWRRHGHSLTGTPKKNGFIGQAKVSIGALDPAPYILYRSMADETRKCLEILSKEDNAHRYAAQLRCGAIWYDLLSKTYDLRAQLYSAQSSKGRISAFASILKLNGYFGPAVRALGWRAFLKDSAFAFGVIG